MFVILTESLISRHFIKLDKENKMSLTIIKNYYEDNNLKEKKK